MQREVLLAGKIKIVRMKCHLCEDFVLVEPFDNHCPYCGSLLNIEMKDDSHVKKRKLTSQPITKRQYVSKKQKEAILFKQDFKCFWCGNLFGEIVFINKAITLKYVFDHITPYSFCGHNSVENLVASCQIYNSWKGSKVFNSETDCRNYLKKKWQNKVEDGDFLVGIPKIA